MAWDRRWRFVTILSVHALDTELGSLQAFYISRLLKFSGKLYPALFCWALVCLRLGGWVLLSVNAIKMQSLIEFKTKFGWLFGMLLGASAGIDLIVAAWIGYFLAKQRDETNPT